MGEKHKKPYDEQNMPQKQPRKRTNTPKENDTSQEEGVTLTDSLLILSLLKRYTDENEVWSAKDLAWGVEYLKTHASNPDADEDAPETDEKALFERKAAHYRQSLLPWLRELSYGNSDDPEKMRLMYHYICFLLGGRVLSTRLDGKSFGYYFIPNKTSHNVSPSGEYSGDADDSASERRRGWIENWISRDVSLGENVFTKGNSDKTDVKDEIREIIGSDIWKSRERTETTETTGQKRRYIPERPTKY